MPMSMTLIMMIIQLPEYHKYNNTQYGNHLSIPMFTDYSDNVSILCKLFHIYNFFLSFFFIARFGNFRGPIHYVYVCKDF